MDFSNEGELEGSNVVIEGIKEGTKFSVVGVLDEFSERWTSLTEMDEAPLLRLDLINGAEVGRRKMLGSTDGLDDPKLSRANDGIPEDSRLVGTVVGSSEERICQESRIVGTVVESPEGSICHGSTVLGRVEGESVQNGDGMVLCSESGLPGDTSAGISDGWLEGDAESKPDGEVLGFFVGPLVGKYDGILVGCIEGNAEDFGDGDWDGIVERLGSSEDSCDGGKDWFLGPTEGDNEEAFVGA